MFFDLIGSFWTVVLLAAGTLAGGILGKKFVHSELSRSDDDYWVAMVFAVVIGAMAGYLAICILPVIIGIMVFFAILYLIGKALKKIFG